MKSRPRALTLLSLAAFLGSSFFSMSLSHADDGITIAEGKAKFDAVGQFWILNDTSLGKESNGYNGAKTDIYIRRAQLQFSGSLTDSTHWLFMIDPAKQITVNQHGTSTILQDFYVSYDMVSNISLTVGQFKTLTVSESVNDTDSEILLPERSMVARTWGESRQMGAMLSYKTSILKVGGMISDGMNTVGNNMQNDGTGVTAYDPQTSNHPNDRELTFRADVTPIEMASFGAFIDLPGMNLGQGGAFGGNVKVIPVEDAVIRGELVRGTAKQSGAMLARNGMFVDGSYMYGAFQPVVRYETQQQGDTSTTVTGSALTFGLNYYLQRHNSKVQLAYTKLGDNTTGSYNPTGGVADPASSASGQYAPLLNGGGGGIATLAFQLAI